MVKNILIPIDFSTQSLNTLKIALREHKGQNLNVWLIYAHNLSTSITELLFYSPKKILQSLINSEFEDALQILKNSHESNLKSIHIELFHGSNTQAFANFAHSKNIDVVYIPKSYRLKSGKHGFDPIKIITNSKISYKEVSWTSDQNDSNSNTINHLFI